jgi:hypothetical protein
MLSISCQRRQAAGNANGDRGENAASIWQLNDMIVAAGPGGTVYVRGDAGPYSFVDNRVNISNGGQVASPVIIIEVVWRLERWVGWCEHWTARAMAEDPLLFDREMIYRKRHVNRQAKYCRPAP